MSIVSQTDEAIWDLPGARMAGPLPGAEVFRATPLFELLSAATRYPKKIALVSQTGSLTYAELVRLPRARRR